MFYGPQYGMMMFGFGDAIDCWLGWLKWLNWFRAENIILFLSVKPNSKRCFNFISSQPEEVSVGKYQMTKMHSKLCPLRLDNTLVWNPWVLFAAATEWDLSVGMPLKENMHLLLLFLMHRERHSYRMATPTISLRHFVIALTMLANVSNSLLSNVILNEFSLRAIHFWCLMDLR